MPREFKCGRCHKYLGEMTKGKIKNNAVILCDKCIGFYKQCDSLLQLKNNTSSNSGMDVPDFLEGLFKK